METGYLARGLFEAAIPSCHRGRTRHQSLYQSKWYFNSFPRVELLSLHRQLRYHSRLLHSTHRRCSHLGQCRHNSPLHRPSQTHQTRTTGASNQQN